MSLLSAAEMSAIQAIGELGMVTTVTIFSTTGDTGLDEDDDPYGSALTVASTGTTTRGWLVGRWANERSTDAGDIDTSTLYRLRLPVGTNIEPGWEVDIDGNRYSVMDAGTDHTWPEWLNCNVRRTK